MCLLTNTLTHSLHVEGSVFKNLIGFKPVKKFPAFYKIQGTFPHSQMTVTSPYPEPALSSPYPHIQQTKIAFTRLYKYFIFSLCLIRMYPHYAVDSQSAVDGPFAGSGQTVSGASS